MAKFVKCSCEQVKYRGHVLQNNPINIELVTQVEKIQERYYPDNEGTPAIRFHGIDKTWVYGQDQAEQRDADYDSIVSNRFNVTTKMQGDCVVAHSRTVYL